MFFYWVLVLIFPKLPKEFMTALIYTSGVSFLPYFYNNQFEGRKESFFLISIYSIVLGSLLTFSWFEKSIDEKHHSQNTIIFLQKKLKQNKKYDIKLIDLVLLKWLKIYWIILLVFFLTIYLFTLFQRYNSINFIEFKTLNLVFISFLMIIIVHLMLLQNSNFFIKKNLFRILGDGIFSIGIFINIFLE